MIATMLGKCVCLGLCICGAAVSAFIGSQIYNKYINENKSNIIEMPTDSVV
jgi:hypothetical protein